MPPSSNGCVCESVYAFANTINTIDGGTHLTGLRAALTRTINDYARRSSLIKENDPNFSGDDTREGLTAIVSIKHPDPSSKPDQADDEPECRPDPAGSGEAFSTFWRKP
jgi:DNA gyrase subunit B